MEDIEQRFLQICDGYNDFENKDFKGALLFKTFQNGKFDEQLLASYVAIKEKFDCLYAFLLTKTRIIEISAYSTMCIVQSRRYKEIKKVIIEQSFDDRKLESIIKDEAVPERVQVRVSFVDNTNFVEDFAIENAEKNQDIIQVLEFAKTLSQLQAE